jgi:hypothetical protein
MPPGNLVVRKMLADELISSIYSKKLNLSTLGT